MGCQGGWFMMFCIDFPGAASRHNHITQHQRNDTHRDSPCDVTLPRFILIQWPAPDLRSAILLCHCSLPNFGLGISRANQKSSPETRVQSYDGAGICCLEADTDLAMFILNTVT